MYIGRRRVGLVLVELVLVEFTEARKALIMSDIRRKKNAPLNYTKNYTKRVWLS